MKLSFIPILLALFLVPHQKAHAYGQTGHRTIGDIAQRHLNDKALAAVQDILGDEELWQASTWPDEMRSNPDHYWQKVAGTFHYINIPEGMTYGEAPKNPKGDAYTALNDFTATLKNPSTNKADKALALRFIVHLVGDMHQPMHFGHAEDWGGNKIKVTFFGKDSNLHSVWDKSLIMSQNLSFTEWVRMLDKADKQTVAKIQSVGPEGWIEEGLEMRGAAYAIGDGKFHYQYIYDNIPTIRRQLLKGGLRLAKYLNDVLGTEN